MTTHQSSTQRLQEVAAKLSTISRKDSYNPYQLFEWPDSLPTADYWTSPELMTCYGTPIWEEFTEQQRLTLSQWESVNFFSLNVHLIRELIGEVADRIYETRFPGLSDFFHDFISEENKHMWFFATFCLRYGGKVYPSGKTFSPASSPENVLKDVMVFGRILIAEELCDAFNIKMAEDKRLPPLVQQINLVHHRDESRHIAFGRQMMRTLCDQAASTTGEDGMRAVGDYLNRYASMCLQSFYNPTMYADAGIENGRRLRARLLENPVRKQTHRDLMNRTTVFLQRLGLYSTGSVPQ
ncbi:MAG TPA: diiron oxygenase [Streptosporangiaceae bacterium]